jgi:ribosomal protein S8
MVGRLFLVQLRMGSNPIIPKEKKKKKVGRQRVNRVSLRKIGSDTGKKEVSLPYTSEACVNLAERRVEHGYLKSWKVESQKRHRKRRYLHNGSPCLSHMKRRSRPSRQRRVTKKERWTRRESPGRRLVQTTKGRRTGEEARIRGRGGIVWRWVG